tara:strand:+ start:56 stop:1072 length:1017 start_codon:yes stop_codon:yes gene_type:complete
MSKHVFVSPIAGTAANVGLGNASDFWGDTAGEVSIWSLDTGANLTANFVSNAGIIVPSKFQITQCTTASTMPYVSPIIDSKRVKKIIYREGTAAVAAATSAVTISANTASAKYGLKIVEKAVGYDYNNFLTPRTPSTYNRAGKVYTYMFESGATTSAAIICQGLVDAINADTEGIVTAALSSTSDITITAREEFTVFEVIDMGAGGEAGFTTTGATALAATWAGTHGRGDGKIVASEEQESLGYRTGLHNRLHLPQNSSTAIPLFTDATQTYDAIQFEIDWSGNNDKAMPGNDTLNITWYFDASSTTGGNIDEVFAGGGANGCATYAVGTDGLILFRR